MEKTKKSNLLRLENETIVYSTGEGESWRLPIRSVQVIGEYTDESWDEDYFFVFVTNEMEQWYEASFYAEGMGLFLTVLSTRLGHQIEGGLCNSTTFKSRILWPKQFAGQELFVFKPETKAAGILGKIRQKIVPKVFFELSESVRNLVGK